MNRKTMGLLRMWLPGQKAGEYLIEEWLDDGEDGRITVLASRKFGTGTEHYILKVIGRKEDMDKKTRERFKRQVRLLDKIRSHPHLPRVYALGEEYGYEYIVQEYIPGKTLEKTIARKGAIPQKGVKEIGTHIASALEYLHTNRVLHRNVKPSTILIDRKRKRGVLAGFGAAKESSEPMMSTAGISIEEIQEMLEKRTIDPYMPPESELGYMDERSDLYCLGVCTHQMLTGRPELDKRPDTLEEKHELARICNRLTREEPKERYQTATELLEDLQKA